MSNDNTYDVTDDSLVINNIPLGSTTIRNILDLFKISALCKEQSERLELVNTMIDMELAMSCHETITAYGEFETNLKKDKMKQENAKTNVVKLKKE